MSGPFDFGTNSTSTSKVTMQDGDDQDHSTVDHSSLSFLGFEVRDLDEDDAILRGIHVALDEDAFGFLDASQDPSSSPMEVAAMSTDSATMAHASPIPCTKDKAQGIRKRRRRKRTRRPCTVLGCPNRVVQGGVCVAHGARRKLCQFPGCDKCVKKAGFCSTHGPARKKCEVPGCSRVAVQGGICIGHGAKKVPCQKEGCRRQALTNGMCRIHGHPDDSQVSSVMPSTPLTTDQLPTETLVPTEVDHFHEIPSLLPLPPPMIAPGTMESTSSTSPFSSDFLAHPPYYEIPNAAVAEAVAQAPAPSQAFQRTMYTRGLSIFEEMGWPAASPTTTGTPMPPPPPLVPPKTSISAIAATPIVASFIPPIQEIFNNDDYEWETTPCESV